MNIYNRASGASRNVHEYLRQGERNDPNWWWMFATRRAERDETVINIYDTANETSRNGDKYLRQGERNEPKR